MKVYYAYHNGAKVNSRPMSKDDVTELHKHDTVSHFVKGKMISIPVKELRIVERIVF